jgi:ribosomal-protein-alanine N-acetyltransferase
MIIRKFVKEDLSQILELCREVRQHHIDILDGYFTEQNDEFEQLGFLQSLENGNMIALVAENNSKICGYLLAERKFSPYLEEPNVVHIANLGVKKEIRGQGIGKELMDTLLKKCEEDNIDEIRLGVFNKNVLAYKFYEQYGFEPFEQRMNLRIKKDK